MLGSSVLETAIGLVFVYLFLSTLVSALNEAIASVLGWRARTLKLGLENLFNNSDAGKQLLHQVMSHSLLKGLSRPPSLLSKIPVLNQLVTDGASYISSKSFSMALLDTILPERLTAAAFPVQGIRASLEQRVADPQLRQSFLTLLAEAGNDLPKFGDELEGWFNNGMDRVSGWYKRKIMAVTFILGLFLAVTLNVDSLELTGRLYRDPTVSASLASEAQAAVQKYQPGVDPEQITQQVLQQAQALPPLLGNWPETPDKINPGFWWFLKGLGILLTGFAVSLGAPFWFDALGKLVSLRGAGPKPASPATGVGNHPGAV